MNLSLGPEGTQTNHIIVGVPATSLIQLRSTKPTARDKARSEKILRILSPLTSGYMKYSVAYSTILHQSNNIRTHLDTHCSKNLVRDKITVFVFCTYVNKIMNLREISKLRAMINRFLNILRNREAYTAL